MKSSNCFLFSISYHTIGMSVPLMNFCRWYSVISRFLTRPRVAHLLLLAPPRWFPTTTAPPWTAWTPLTTPPLPLVILKLFFIIVLLLPPVLLCVEVGLCVKYGHISEAEKIIITKLKKKGPAIICGSNQARSVATIMLLRHGIVCRDKYAVNFFAKKSTIFFKKS